MNIIEELKNIPGMEPVADLIQTVIELDEDALNDESFELIKNSIKESISGENREETIKNTNKSYRANHATVEQVKAENAAIVDAFEQIKNNIDVENEYKKKIIEASFDEMTAVIKEAAEQYFEEDVEIFVEKVHENAKIPTYADFASSGADIYATEDFTVAKSSRGKLVKTGLKMAIPLGWELQVRPRSGLSLKTAMRISNAPGTIDAGYPDEVGVIIDNLSSKDIEVKAGDRIAQLIVAPVYKAKFTEVPSVSEPNAWSPRSGGFGSTGK